MLTMLLLLLPFDRIRDCSVIYPNLLWCRLIDILFFIRFLYNIRPSPQVLHLITYEHNVSKQHHSMSQSPGVYTWQVLLVWPRFQHHILTQRWQVISLATFLKRKRLLAFITYLHKCRQPCLALIGPCPFAVGVQSSIGLGVWSWKACAVLRCAAAR